MSAGGPSHDERLSFLLMMWCAASARRPLPPFASLGLLLTRVGEESHSRT